MSVFSHSLGREPPPGGGTKPLISTASAPNASASSSTRTLTVSACARGAARLYKRERRPYLTHGAALSPDPQEVTANMATEDLPRLTDEEKLALAALLKRTIDADRYPLSRPLRRYAPLRAAAKQRRARKAGKQ